MVCIHCGGKTQVINSRPRKRNNQVWRRRECLACQAVFSTEESVQYGGSWTVRASPGGLEPFSRDKLFLSLYRSCGHRPTALSDAAGLTDTVIRRLLPRLEGGILTNRAIVQTAQVALNRFDRAASTHYQAFHKG
jgi:transcriptional repressor NrdR